MPVLWVPQNLDYLHQVQNGWLMGWMFMGMIVGLVFIIVVRAAIMVACARWMSLGDVLRVDVGHAQLSRLYNLGIEMIFFE